MFIDSALTPGAYATSLQVSGAFGTGSRILVVYRSAASPRKTSVRLRCRAGGSGDWKKVRVATAKKSAGLVAP